MKKFEGKAKIFLRRIGGRKPVKNKIKKKTFEESAHVYDKLRTRLRSMGKKSSRFFVQKEETGYPRQKFLALVGLVTYTEFNH